MGMSTHLVLLRDPDTEKHNRMIAAVQALRVAGVSILPVELQEYFGCYEVGEVSEDGCLEVGSCSILDKKEKFSGIRVFRVKHKEGFEIKLKDVPEGVDIIRVYNSH